MHKTYGVQGASASIDAEIEQKSPLMIVCFIGLWLLSLVYFGPRLWQLITTSDNIIEFLLLSAYSAMLIIFWMLAAYYIAVILFSFFSKSIPQPEVAQNVEWPEVAILYPTCNDFQAEAALSCLRQDYPNFHLFLLDDSSVEEYQKAVNAFHATYPQWTTVVRRPNRDGYKAGNLNHALRGPVSDYPFFTVVDADERIPSDLLRRTMAYMLNSRLAFVQANHAPHPQQVSAFAYDMGPSILPFWNVHCRPRNRYGLVLFLGHGALVRRSAWELVQGFPEVVTEDLGFSISLAQKGLRGIFLEDLVCYEDFPTSYLAFKRQQERYLIGTTQVIRNYTGPLLRSQKMSWIEKVDFFLWCSPLYVPALVLIFLIVAGLGLTLVFGNWQTPAVAILGRKFTLPPIGIIQEPFSLLSSWDFQVFSIVCALSPTFATLGLGLTRRLSVVRLLFLSTVPYLSLMVVSWRGILGYLVKGRIIWPPTGEVAVKKKGSLLQLDHDNEWRSPLGWEIIIGVFLCAVSIATINFAFFAVSSCLLLGVGIQYLGWDKRLVRLACTGCFAIILFQILINLSFLGHSSPLPPLIFSVHF